MSELEELRKLLAETSDPKKQTTIIAKIRKLEKQLGIKPPAQVSEDRLAVWKDDEEEETVIFNKNGGIVTKPI